MLCVHLSLTERADRAKLKAEGTLGVAERVVDALDEAKLAQDAAEAAVMQASDDIQVTQTHLTQVYLISFFFCECEVLMGLAC